MPKIRVMVVDDAVVMRKMISEVLSRDPQIEVVGTAANGSIALQKIPQISPDLITLDIEMPEMDGLTTLREIRKIYPKIPVIMFSTLTERGAKTTLEALNLGANDYVTKPGNVGGLNEGIARLESELLPKIKAHCRKIRNDLAPGDHTQFISKLKPAVIPPSARMVPIEVVCVASSTGGPNALAEVFGRFPAGFPVPVLVVQHMPPIFTGLLAERLSLNSGIKFTEGKQGERVEAGRGYIAPGGMHMEVKRIASGLALYLHEGPPENSCRPAADVLFRSAVSVFGSATLGVVLTGMGQDGMRGCQLIREQQGQVIAQDEKTSVVWGMPGAVCQAGLADKILPLSEICNEIVRRVRQSREIRRIAA